MAVGGVLAAVIPSGLPWWVVVGYSAVVGVGIDFDHFLVARLNTGSWRAARRCLANPRLVFLDQSAIFEPREVLVLQRLLTHAVIGGALVLGLWLPGYGTLAVVTAVVLYAHVLADLVHDNREFPQRAREFVEGQPGVTVVDDRTAEADD